MALTDGILAYWKLDNASWLDSTGNGYTLTNTSGTVTVGTGIIGGDATFDGASLLSTTANLPISGSGPFSYSCWIKWAGTIDGSGYNTIIGTRGSGSSGAEAWAMLLAGSGSVLTVVQYAGGFNFQTDPIIEQDTWYHLAVTNDGMFSKFYFNGSFLITGESAPENLVADYPLNLGMNTQGDQTFAGQIDEVGIWERVLSDAEISSLYNLGNAIQYPFDFIYYNNAQEDGNWGNLGNWWLNSAYSTQSTYLPTTETNIVVAGNITQNTFFSSVTISGTDNDGTYTRNNIGEDFVFDDWGIIYNGGTSYSLYNHVDTVGTSTDNCQTWSSNFYTITTTNKNFDCVCHDAQFNSVNFATGLVLNSYGVVNMQGSSVFSGTATDSISLYDTSYVDTTAIIGGNATFRDSSVNTGTINGNAYVYYDGGNGQFPIGGYVDGSVTYFGWPAKSPQYFNDMDGFGVGEDGDFNNPNNWWADETYTTRPINAQGHQELPDPSTDIFCHNYEIYANTGPAAACNSATFIDYGLLSIPLICSAGATFNNGVLYALSYGSGQVIGDAVFNGDSYQIGYVTGNAKFTSNLSLNNSFNYQETWAGLAPSHIGSFTSAVALQKKAFSLTSLLKLPWFINI